MTTPIKKLMLAMAAAFALCLGARAANEDKTWMVVDLRTGALSYYGYDLATATNTFNTPLYKTEKMVFRRIPAGLYWVRDGSARAFMENDYYMAMFTVTVGQYAIITNSAAVVDQNDEENLKPKLDITWQEWEGTDNLGYYFPNKASTGPIGQLEQRIHGNAPDTQEWLSMDLPTISMWEVAARAMPANDGSHKSWKWFFGATSDDIDLYAWRYDSTEWYATYQPVGLFLPNDWGFYDILGNCGQWCLDGIADWPAGDEIYHYSQRPCRRAYSRGAAPYGWWSLLELKEDGERVLHEWGDDEAWGYRYSCGGSISDSSYLDLFTISDVGAWFSSDMTWRRGARLAIVCRNEVSAPPVTVTWQDNDGNVIEADAVSFGTMPSYGGATPTKPSTVYGTYEFTGWTPQIGLAVSNTTYTAKFDSHTIYYAIKWLNWDGTELYADSHWYGYSPGYYGPAPAKPSTVEHEYTFTGWSPEPAAVTGETTYVAQFMQSARKYDIAWLNYDGSTNATSLTPYNTIPEFVGETPTKPADVQYAYTFAGWTPELEPATSNTAYTAVFDESIREYPVNFYNNTGSELLFTTNVPYGSTPEYLGETPTKPSTAQYHYSFAGWGRDMMVVDGPSFYNNYYAEFDPILRSYDITWVNYDGTVLCVTNGPYGITPVYNGATPTKPPTATTQFVFSGWTETVVPVTEPATYTAAYTETPRPYPVTWLDYDGTVLCVTNVPCGETPTYPGETLKRPGYYFNGWTPAVEAVTEEAAYTATYKNMVQDSDGYYLLGSVQDWQGFATLVEATPTANAKMIADIDLGDDQTHIGSMYENSNGGPDYSVYYKGIFDGQGHTLTVAYDALDKQISAPFTKIQGALVKNLHVAGTIHAVSAYIGVVGMTSGDNCISNVWMSADITRPQSGWLFSASILGRYESGTVTIVDCLFTGSSIGGGERYMGCFVGGTRDYYARVVIRNCLSVGTFDRGSGISSSVHANCYVKQFPTDIPAEMQVTDEQLADGTTAAALQAGREEAVWVQDAEMGHPMLKMFGKKETTVTVGGVAVGEVVRGEDGKTLSFAVAAGTDAGDVKLDIGGVDVTKGFRVTVNGTEARAVLLAPYEVPKEDGAPDEIWTENGDGTVTLNVTVVPGLYYAADAAESIDALACPGASAPATGATTLTAPKPVGDKGFFKVWVSETPLKADD